MVSQTLATDGKPAFVSAPPSPEEIAGRFPGFEILECLGRGGMGVVYKARQKSLDRVVAIKILAPEKHGEERFAARFAREAATLAKLNHPNIVTIHDFGETGGWFYIVMEYVEGVNLRDLVSEGKLAPEQALAIVPPICDALQYAHEQGVVHRDIKPENILLDKGGRVRIADFGIAALMGGSGEPAGTPPYAAPEQTLPNAAADHRADIHALGVVFYEMLTGERPTAEMLAPSRRAGTDRRLDDMVLRAMAKDPAERFQTAAEFRTAVEALEEESGFVRERSRWKKWAHPAATVALLGAVGFLLWKQSQPAPQVAKPATVENQAPVDVANMRLDDFKTLLELKPTPPQAEILLSRAEKEITSEGKRSTFCSTVIMLLSKNGFSEEAWKLISPIAGVVRQGEISSWFRYCELSPTERMARIGSLNGTEDRKAAMYDIFSYADADQLCELDFNSLAFRSPEERTQAERSFINRLEFTSGNREDRSKLLEKTVELVADAWLNGSTAGSIFAGAGGSDSFAHFDLLERKKPDLPRKDYEGIRDAIIVEMADEDPNRAVRTLVEKVPVKERYGCLAKVYERMRRDAPETCVARIEALLPEFDAPTREQLRECVAREALRAGDLEQVREWTGRISNEKVRRELNESCAGVEERRKQELEKGILDRKVSPDDFDRYRPKSF